MWHLCWDALIQFASQDFWMSKISGIDFRTFWFTFTTFDSLCSSGFIKLPKCFHSKKRSIFIINVGYVNICWISFKWAFYLVQSCRQMLPKYYSRYLRFLFNCFVYFYQIYPTFSENLCRELSTSLLWLVGVNICFKLCLHRANIFSKCIQCLFIQTLKTSTGTFSRSYPWHD